MSAVLLVAEAPLGNRRERESFLFAEDPLGNRCEEESFLWWCEDRLLEWNECRPEIESLKEESKRQLLAKTYTIVKTKNLKNVKHIIFDYLSMNFPF